MDGLDVHVAVHCGHVQGIGYFYTKGMWRLQSD